MYSRAKPAMSSLLLRVLLMQLAATAATVECLLSASIPGCLGVCGGVEIPYPFGVGASCSRKGFEIDCINNGSAGEIPVLPTPGDQNIRVLHLSVSPLPEARVLLPVAWRCFNSTGDVTGMYEGDVDFNREGVYRISNTENELYVLGCNTYAYTNGVRVYNARFRYRYFTGCITVTNDKTDPRDGACAGLGCCRVDIPPGITDTSMTLSGWSHANQAFCPCDYAFIVEKGNYSFKAADLVSHVVPDNQTMPLRVDWTMPLRLDWAIRDNGSMTSISCAQAPNKPDHEYGCRSNHSECTDSTNGPGYFCKCAHGYEGNPYLVGGCTNANECQDPESYHCPSGSKCIDTEGGYKCQCKFGRRGKRCDPLIPMSAVALLATFVAVVLGCVAIVLLQTRNNRKRFNKNGGKILKAQGITTYNKSELKKITNGYSKRIGGGHFGNVYEGTIIDGTKVAVKRSTVSYRHWKSLIRPRVQQQQGLLEEDGSFINEIKFQFDARHQNMVQLLGCCLETDTPMLVFEFVSNGSLDDTLHSAKKPCTLSLLKRLDIAIGSAEAIAYMHSLDNQKHVHGDIKPSNILLDQHLNPKVSDFGSSKLLAVDSYYVRAVAGDTGYMDPLYIKTQHFTLECDVYSFGVVLLELITRRRARYEDQGKKILSVEFVRCFKDHGSGRAMYDNILDFSGEGAQSRCNLHCLDMIGMLAVRCLNEDKRERPTMAEVVEELKRVKVRNNGLHQLSSEFEARNADEWERSNASKGWSAHELS